MNGILYIASGRKYHNEAVNAIKRTKKIMPSVPIALCTDWKGENKCKEIDYYIELENPSYTFGDKVNNYYNSPFDKTIFLDTDTYIIDSIEVLFEMLDRFDVLASHAPIEEDEIIMLPEAFAEMNSGVIAYKKNKRTEKMFEMYKSNYEECYQYYTTKYNDVPPDQPSFRYAVYHTDVKFCFLPHEYNCMVDFPCFLSNIVHIIHGHYENEIMGRKAELINENTDLRLYNPNKGVIL